MLEPLEDRTVLSSYTASSVRQLIDAINDANLHPGPNTIMLAPGTTFTLTAAVNTDVLGYGDANGLPVIAANDNLTIVGNGDILERSTATETPWFRFFEVASGASLSLAGLTLQGGRAGDRWGGGAIYSQGSLRLNSVVVQNNIARNVNQGGISQGGGIYSSGSLTVTSSTIQNNRAVGIDAGPYGDGGSSQGGGLYVLGTASLTSVTTASNTAQGGNGGKAGWIYWDNGTKTKIAGGNGGDASGGGIYIGAGATVDLHNGTVTGNSAIGGQGARAAVARMASGKAAACSSSPWPRFVSTPSRWPASPRTRPPRATRTSRGRTPPARRSITCRHAPHASRGERKGRCGSGARQARPGPQSHHAVVPPKHGGRSPFPRTPDDLQQETPAMATSQHGHVLGILPRKGRRAPVPRRKGFSPRLEGLEERTVLSTLIVTNALDSGAGSLRAAIQAAKGGDKIVFAPSLNGQTITLTSGELAISKSLDIEGPGAGLLTISGNHAGRVFDVRGYPGSYAAACRLYMNGAC